MQEKSGTLVTEEEEKKYNSSTDQQFPIYEESGKNMCLEWLKIKDECQKVMKLRYFK